MMVSALREARKPIFAFELSKASFGFQILIAFQHHNLATVTSKKAPFQPLLPKQFVCFDGATMMLQSFHRHIHLRSDINTMETTLMNVASPLDNHFHMLP